MRLLAENADKSSFRVKGGGLCSMCAFQHSQGDGEPKAVASVDNRPNWMWTITVVVVMKVDQGAHIQVK